MTKIKKGMIMAEENMGTPAAKEGLGKGALIAIVAIGVVAVLGAGYAIGKYSANKTSEEAVTTETPPVPDEPTATTSTTTSATATTSATDETAGWKTYTNETYGFSFKYPKKWPAEGSSNSAYSNFQVSVDDRTGSDSEGDRPALVVINIYDSVSKLDTQSLGATSLKSYLDKYSAIADPKYTNISSAIINATTGYKADAGPNEYGGGTYYYAENSGKIFSIWFFTSSNNYTEGFAKSLLSTFQFTK